MREIWGSVEAAFSLLFHPDRYLLSTILVSFKVSGIALLICFPVSAALAAAISLGRFPGRGAVKLLVRTAMGLPSVVVGLLVLLVLSEAGPFKGLLWTPRAMVISQLVLITPLVLGVMISSLEGVSRRVAEAAHVLGANRLQVAWAVMREARLGFLTAAVAGFGRAIAEVGSVLIVGGNIAWADGTSYTRTLTTAIVVESRKGNFEAALAFGIVLMVLVLAVNLVLGLLGRPEEAR
jgi:tungstate transport system permease protein